MGQVSRGARTGTPAPTPHMGGEPVVIGNKVGCGRCASIPGSWWDAPPLTLQPSGDAGRFRSGPGAGRELPVGEDLVERFGGQDPGAPGPEPGD
jgi:hypothetical protein